MFKILNLIFRSQLIRKLLRNHISMLHKRFNEKIAIYLAKIRDYSEKFRKNYKKEKGNNAIVNSFL